MPLSQIEAEEYTQGLEQTVSGGWRLYAWAQRNGIPEALGLSIEEWIERIGGYVRLSAPNRRDAVAELASEGHETKQIASILGVDERTIRRDKEKRTNVRQESKKSNDNNKELNGERTNVREEEVGQQNLRSTLLMNSAASIQCAVAVYNGPVDQGNELRMANYLSARADMTPKYQRDKSNASTRTTHLHHYRQGPAAR